MEELKCQFKHVDDQGPDGLEAIGLMPCVNSIGNIRTIKYIGNKMLAIDTDDDFVYVHIEEDESEYYRSGFFRIILPEIKCIMPLYHDVQILSALLRAGLMLCDNYNQMHWNSKAVMEGTVLSLPTVNQAWNDIGGRFRITVDEKVIIKLVSTIVNINAKGFFLFNPDEEFQGGEFICAEDKLMAIIMRESRNGLNYEKNNRIESLIGYHTSYYSRRVECHKRLAKWMRYVWQ